MCAGRKLPSFNVWIEIGLFFSVRAENDLLSGWGSIDLVFVWVVEIDLVVCEPEITWFSCEHQNRLDVRVGIEIDLISVMGSKLTRFL